MNCNQLRNLLKVQTITEFSRSQAESAEEHVLECLECKNLLIGERQIDSLLRELPEPVIDYDLSPQVMAIVRQQKRPEFLAKNVSAAQRGEWPITLIVAAFATTLCMYSYELLNGRSTVFNLFALWTRDWTQWLFQPLQLNFIGLVVAASFLTYLAGFLLLFRQRE
ncbi:MAG: hypothetical protein GKR93_13815 [Gammaproteobacteria bacterium]|nr:hypothetical protein [Gammaproteobacteria bacterium]